MRECEGERVWHLVEYLAEVESTLGDFHDLTIWGLSCLRLHLLVAVDEGEVFNLASHGPI